MTCTVQTFQTLADAPGYGAGWRTINTTRTKREADDHAAWLCTQSFGLGIRVQITHRDGYTETFVHRAVNEETGEII